jgi:ribosomal protein S12 methylthiotransferase accessory factor
MNMGVTRIANVTGLDIVGLPVVSVCRPNGRTNSVFQGKGLDLDQAKASAVMEAVESFCAENIMRPIIYASAADLGRSGRLVDLELLPRPRGSLYGPDRRILWIEGRGLSSGATQWLPFEAVHLDYGVPSPPGSGCFLCSSNGLASGNSLDEGIAHALCELIERDSAAIWHSMADDVRARRVVLSSIDDADSLSILRRFDEAGLAVAVWEITSDIAVATFRCHLMEREGGPHLLPLPAEGFGCHTDRGIALARAMAEAAQSRLTLIMGARDDMGTELYEVAFNDSQAAEWRRSLLSSDGVREFHAAPSYPMHATPEDEIAEILTQIASAGLPEPIFVDLTPSGTNDFAVVRVVAPGLEAPPQADCPPGIRATRARRSS